MLDGNTPFHEDPYAKKPDPEVKETSIDEQSTDSEYGSWRIDWDGLGWYVKIE